MTVRLDAIRTGLLHVKPEAQDRFGVRFPDGTTLAMLEKLSAFYGLSLDEYRQSGRWKPDEVLNRSRATGSGALTPD